MSVAARRATYLAVVAVIVPLSGWAGTATAWETVFGQRVGGSLAVFFDLQVETWAAILLFAPIVDLVYGLHMGADGWDLVPQPWPVRAAVYVGLLVLVLLCSFEGPVRAVIEVGTPDDIAASVAHYLRRALEGVLTVIGLMLFLDLVRPGRLASR